MIQLTLEHLQNNQLGCALIIWLLGTLVLLILKVQTLIKIPILHDEFFNKSKEVEKITRFLLSWILITVIILAMIFQFFRDSRIVKAYTNWFHKQEKEIYNCNTCSYKDNCPNYGKII
jgi:hypothetical protein